MIVVIVVLVLIFIVIIIVLGISLFIVVGKVSCKYMYISSHKQYTDNIYCRCYYCMARNFGEVKHLASGFHRYLMNLKKILSSKI